MRLAKTPLCLYTVDGRTYREEGQHGTGAQGETGMLRAPVRRLGGDAGLVSGAGLHGQGLGGQLGAAPGGAAVGGGFSLSGRGRGSPRRPEAGGVSPPGAGQRGSLGCPPKRKLAAAAGGSPRPAGQAHHPVRHPEGAGGVRPGEAPGQPGEAAPGLYFGAHRRRAVPRFAGAGLGPGLLRPVWQLGGVRRPRLRLCGNKRRPGGGGSFLLHLVPGRHRD